MTALPELRLTDDEKAALWAWRDTNEENNVLPFRIIAEWSGTPKAKVRRVTRSLARKGLLELTTGFNDEGAIMGRGYMPTSAGIRAIASVCFQEIQS